MKTIKLLVVALAGACMLFSADAFAQEKTKVSDKDTTTVAQKKQEVVVKDNTVKQEKPEVSAKDNNVKQKKQEVSVKDNTVKQEKAKFSDNLFAIIEGGVNYSVPKIAKPETWGGIGIGTDVQIGKWWSPSFGTSIGWHGLTAKTAATLYQGGINNGNSYGLNYACANVLWDISNTIGGYKERFWDFIPYAHAGLLLQESKGFFGFGGGLLNKARISDSIALTLDLRALIYNRAPHDINNTETCCLLMYPSASIGVSINLGKSTFVAKQ